MSLQWKRMAAVASGLVVIAACGGGSSTSPDTFWADLDTAVADFAADLNETDAEFQGRSWELPTERSDVAEWYWRNDLELQDAYIGAWEDYVDRLAGLEPPEGYPEAGEGYAEGLPEYFETAIVESERAALAAMQTYRERIGDVTDPEGLANLTLPEDQRRPIDEARQAILDAEDVLEDEWETFEDSADEVGHPIDDTVELRFERGMDFLPLRSGRLVSDVARAVIGIE